MKVRPYDPERIRLARQRVKEDPALIKPLSIYSRIEYECRECGGRFFGDQSHVCRPHPDDPQGRER